MAVEQIDYEGTGRPDPETLAARVGDEAFNELRGDAAMAGATGVSV
jgi:hypothetical protein